MNAYRFNTRISENGVISLPFEPQLFNTEVEIFIIPTQKLSTIKGPGRNSENEFSGILKNLPAKDKNDLRYEFLRKKYHINNDASEEEIEQARYEYLREKHGL